jgi:hypothetical protein
MPELIARTRVKVGSKSLGTARDRIGPFDLSVKGKYVEPGDRFVVDEPVAEELVRNSAAMTISTAGHEARAIVSRGEELPDLYRTVAQEARRDETARERLDRAIAEARDAGLEVTVEGTQ